MDTAPRTLDHKILAVVSDQHLRHSLQCHLQKSGFHVTLAYSGNDMRKLWQYAHYDLLFLDTTLPDDNGLAICRRLRNEHNNTPIIILTTKATDTDRIASLEMGADDFLTVPFNPRELLARTKAVLRRNSAAAHPAAPLHQSEVVTFGAYKLNLSTRILTSNDIPIHMTSGEFSLLKAFVLHPKIPLSRDKLMELTRGREYQAFDRSLDVQISRLRKLLEPNPAKPVYIQTVWGMGYVFIPDNY